MSKEVEQLKADLELVTKTAKVLATKLEKISEKVDLFLSSIEGGQIPQEAFMEPDQSRQPSIQTRPSMDTKVPTQAPRPSSPSMSQRMVSESKATRLLDSFLGQVQTMTSGKEISAALSRLRDQVMQSAEVGFHPAFHEMGRYADQIKKISTISAPEKEELLEKIYDWKTRLST
ncbi:MAG: hypothetical protein ACFFAU_05535 [Candidatus Hodarchaeota archaeon]